MKRKDKLYALYHGDKFIDIGTKDYLAQLINVKRETITFYNSDSYQRREDLSNRYVVVDCYYEEGEEDEEN